MLAAALAVTAAAALAAPASAQFPAACPGVTSTDGIAQRPGPPLRFGISPGVQTGQLGTGPVPPRTPEDPIRQRTALAALVPPGVPFVLRLTRFFWSDGEAGVERFLALAGQYTSEGYLVELQLRYHPTPAEEGDIPAWTSFVREVVDRFGPNRRVVGLQVTNEVNLSESSDSSDGSYSGGRDALIQGVIAAKDEARRRGFTQLEVGFNWADRSDPDSDSSFWSYLNAHGGPAFRAALDWIGLDAYPGSFFPPAEAPGREGDGLINGVSALRCYAESAGIPDSVPMHIEENGYPTGSTPDRSYARQAQALQTMVQAASDFRGTYDISDYRWFDLRDSDSTSPNFQQQYGLMTDTYTPKPAFAVYRNLIASLSARTPSSPSGRKAKSRRPRLRAACRGSRVRLEILSAATVRHVRFIVGHRRVSVRRRPFEASFRASGSYHLARARVTLENGRTLSLAAAVPACRAARFAG